MTPTPWLTDSLPLRGCALCDFGRDLATDDPAQPGHLCRHPEVARLTRPTPAPSAQRSGGACGPEAKYLTIKGREL